MKLLSGIDPPVAADAASDTGPAAARRAKLTQMAEQFEAMLLTQMIRQMRQSMLGNDTEDGETAGLGSQTMTDTIDAQLGESLSHTSRIGVADFIVRAFDRQAGTAPEGSASRLPGGSHLEASAVVPAWRRAPSNLSAGSAQPAGISPAPIGTAATVQADLAAALPPGVVSSTYGWRNDPITGQTRFHSGTDVKMAYGQDVRAPTGGRVAFVGVQGGYGLTVIVDHGAGIETRYAHLSSAPIKQGDPVEAGQIIGQSGNSGRSTGPHLHFEVLDNGQPVDPRTVAGLQAARTIGTD